MKVMLTQPPPGALGCRVRHHGCLCHHWHRTDHHHLQGYRWVLTQATGSAWQRLSASHRSSPLHCLGAPSSCSPAQTLTNHSCAACITLQGRQQRNLLVSLCRLLPIPAAWQQRSDSHSAGEGGLPPAVTAGGSSTWVSSPSALPKLHTRLPACRQEQLPGWHTAGLSHRCSV